MGHDGPRKPVKWTNYKTNKTCMSFFRNNRKSLQIDTKRNDMLNLKRFQSATSRQPGCYATNIRIYGWILWNLNLPGSRLNPLFFCWTNPWWIQRPLRVLLGAKICLFSKKRTSFFQVTLWSRKWRPLWTFKKGHLNIPPKGHLGSNLENLNFFPYAKKVFFFFFRWAFTCFQQSGSGE